ncbi:transporter accessory protein [[Clostridium] innocuum]|nr:transporter accessory protein [[Clostridium] innocuum]
MKKIVLLLMVSLLCACSANTKTEQTKTNTKDSYCSDESDKSSACDIDESADMSGYQDFKDTKNQFVESDMKEALSVFQKKESAILYFGYPGCPWCVEALPIMNEVAKADKQHILYIQTRDDKKELLYTQDQKKEMISYTKQFMEKDDEGEYQLYVPFVVVVKDGKAVSGHIGTVDGHDAHERSMTDKEKQELKKLYEDMFSAVSK